jgi:hypothetical protein
MVPACEPDLGVVCGVLLVCGAVCAAAIAAHATPIAKIAPTRFIESSRFIQSTPRALQGIRHFRRMAQLRITDPGSQPQRRRLYLI